MGSLHFSIFEKHILSTENSIRMLLWGWVKGAGEANWWLKCEVSESFSPNTLQMKGDVIVCFFFRKIKSVMHISIESLE